MGYRSTPDRGKRGLDGKLPIIANAFSQPGYEGDWVWDFSAM